MNDTTKRNLSFLSNVPSIEGVAPELVADVIYSVYPGIYTKSYTAHLAFRAQEQGKSEQALAQSQNNNEILPDDALNDVAQEAIRCGASLAFSMTRYDWKGLFQTLAQGESSGQTQRRTA